MTKITAEHLARSAIVYIRQSTSYQVANNLEDVPARSGAAGNDPEEWGRRACARYSDHP
jgi:hypothetical protein